MGLGILNNLSSLQAQNQLYQTSQSLQTTLYQLSSGSRINSGADDPAGLAIANQMGANIAALSQSVNNANTGIGIGQVQEGALGQVTNLLNRAVTLATEASNGGLSSSQSTALDGEYQSIVTEIAQINTTTTAAIGPSGSCSVRVAFCRVLRRELRLEMAFCCAV